MLGFAELHSVEQMDELNDDAGWQIEYRQLRPRAFLGQFWFGQTSVFEFTREAYAATLEVAGTDRHGAFSLLIRQPSTGELQLNGNSMGCRDQFLLSPGDELWALTKSNISVDALSIPVSRFVETAEAFELEWRGFFTGPSRRLQLPVKLVHEITRTLDAAVAGGSAECEPPDADSKQVFDSFVISVLSPEDEQALQKRRPKLGNLRQLRDALDFIDAHLAEPLTVARVCEQTGIGIRTLQRQFVREMGIGPIAYIKARRLNAARRSLIMADPEDTSVSRVAGDHGITQLGRFAGEYRRFFGEQPSETLRSSPDRRKG